MRNRHIKKLALARYLQTKAEPKIVCCPTYQRECRPGANSALQYYLPWQRTDEERDIIDQQRREARELVQREESEFDKRRKWHVERHGEAVRPRPPSPPREQPRPPTASPAPSVTISGASPMKVDDEEDDKQEDTQHEGHDDAGDIVEHDGEDMVIY